MKFLFEPLYLKVWSLEHGELIEGRSKDLASMHKQKHDHRVFTKKYNANIFNLKA